MILIFEESRSSYTAEDPHPITQNEQGKRIRRVSLPAKSPRASLDTEVLIKAPSTKHASYLFCVYKALQLIHILYL